MYVGLCISVAVGSHCVVTLLHVEADQLLCHVAVLLKMPISYERNMNIRCCCKEAVAMDKHKHWLLLQSGCCAAARSCVTRPQSCLLAHSSWRLVLLPSGFVMTILLLQATTACKQQLLRTHSKLYGQCLVLVYADHIYGQHLSKLRMCG